MPMLLAAPVGAARPVSVRVDLPAGTLGNSLIRLAEQTGATIGITDPGLSRLPVRAVRGRFSLGEALDRLLKRSGAAARQIDAMTWRVVPAAPLTMPDRPVPSRHLDPPASDIVITAAKTGTSRSRYAGTVAIIDSSEMTLAQQSRGTDALVERLPGLSSTHLGSGRNKLFIRGIADSSFNGPSQALVGQYLGDVRLNYNAPDPDLSLYDVDTVEVIEGPQGTLYGAGSLAGILRIVPHPVDMAETEGSLAAGRSFTTHGGPGLDLVGMINSPIARGIGARLVVFDNVEGGYIDDAARGRSHVNHTRKKGGRATVRLDADAWRVELAGVVQNVETRDGQYAERGLPPLTRSSRVAQPFDNDYSLASVTVSRRWGATSLVSASAVVRQDTDSRFDFTPQPTDAPRIFDQHSRITLFSNETRLSRLDAAGRGWVVGANLIHDEEKLTRAVGAPENPARVLGVDNSVTDAALFGEAGIGLTPQLVATLGVRLEYTHLVGEALDRDAAIGEPRRNEKTFLPSMSVSWHARDGLLVFARYQEGFRPGGLSITSDIGGPLIERFHGDDLGSAEAGLKWTSAGAGRVEADLTVSHARWENIQADLVDQAGLPFTANIGSGRIWSAEVRSTWRPLAAVRLTAGLFASDSRLTDPSSNFAADHHYELPNVAHLGASFGAAIVHDLGRGWRVNADARVHYVGHSRLGVGPALDLRQGDYSLAAASLRVGSDRWGMTIDAHNLANNRGNMFALGNPFSVAAGRQVVPPRPRTIRVGIDAHF